VLELGALIAGPFCTKLLGEFGAEVTKIEPPGQGDPLRKWRYVRDGTSVWWHVQSRNKRSVALDLRTPDGQAIARKLAQSADVVVENFRPGTLEEWAWATRRWRRPIPGSSWSASPATARRARTTSAPASA
jgi:crotonobetainyl-CoA:carnitine CoA-transferase CaiB-like acyl-CoA transferase